MAPSVSVPEKTLEHWASLYVMYRYRSKAALWCPARGEDLDIGLLPTRPGKVVQLEMKTTTIVGKNLHEVRVDLGQLWEYRQRPLGSQPFYVFPWPHWKDELDAAARAKGRPVTELAFARSGSGWWFADWLVVLTAKQVADVLEPELTMHGSRNRGYREKLVRFDLNQHPMAHAWGPEGTASPPDFIPWRDFWPKLDCCGQSTWPQTIMLPAYFIEDLETLPRERMIALLRRARDFSQADGVGSGELVALTPAANESYQVVREAGYRRSAIEPVDQSEGHRQVVFLDAAALLRTT